MRIQKIILNNFRVYQGEQQLNFRDALPQNITLISGKNGFGKTSFLTSLVWCLYGKLMADVDDKYREEIADAGGYVNYCSNTFNQSAKAVNAPLIEILQKRSAAAPAVQRISLKEEIEALQTFSVEIVIIDVYLPSFPCKTLSIKRSHNIYRSKEQEEVTILIDGQENELSKEVGPEIFINDFLLPKEIAKFFFFDAEKIVSLAETKTAEEKRHLSMAYSEVLGIKKYLELRSNLENMRHRLAKDTASATEKEKFNTLTNQQVRQAQFIKELEKDIEYRVEEIASKKEKSNQYQENLIREGSAITLKQFLELKTKKEQLAEKQQELKKQVKDMLDLAPFAMVPSLMEKVRRQIEAENTSKLATVLPEMIRQKIQAVEKDLVANRTLSNEQVRWINNLVQKHFRIEEQQESIQALLSFSSEQVNRFQALYENLNGSYKIAFDALAKEFKLNQGQYFSTTQELSRAESKENDSIIQEIRGNKEKLDNEIAQKENELIEKKARLLHAGNELDSLKKQTSELSKKITLNQKQLAKDETTRRLIGELDSFIHELRMRKKISLEERLKSTLNILMHKSGFVSRVNVIIEGEMIDVELYDSKDRVIRKEGLSKGEQQLFATAMLKALVDESSVKFPVFIDSPLQKLDREHAQNIIRYFYPAVSEQVILFPLLGKEMSAEEYSWLKPSVADAYLITNKINEGSHFEYVDPDKILHLIEEKTNHVIH
jgi:DNA sulfur modification protein DndD